MTQNVTLLKPRWVYSPQEGSVEGKQAPHCISHLWHVLICWVNPHDEFSSGLAWRLKHWAAASGVQVFSILCFVLHISHPVHVTSIHARVTCHLKSLDGLTGNVASLFIHYLMVHLNDNEMRGLITATQSCVCVCVFVRRADCKVKRWHHVYLCMCLCLWILVKKWFKQIQGQRLQLLCCVFAEQCCSESVFLTLSEQPAWFQWI